MSQNKSRSKKELRKLTNVPKRIITHITIKVKFSILNFYHHILHATIVKGIYVTIYLEREEYYFFIINFYFLIIIFFQILIKYFVPQKFSPFVNIV
jgi:hypothetical protein